MARARKRRGRRRRRGSRVEDMVASRYRRGGYRVAKHRIVKLRGTKGEIDILAEKGRQRFAIEVKGGSQRITAQMIRKIHSKAKAVHARPKLVYTRGRPTGPARTEAKRLGVDLKRITKGSAKSS